jgi:hypothetical protein
VRNTVPKRRTQQGVGRSLTKMPVSPGAQATGETQAYLAQIEKTNKN